MPAKLISLLCFLLFCGNAAALDAAQRHELLEAIRPQAAKMAGQPVRFKVDILNVDGDWALLIGKLMGQPGQPLDWDTVPNCDPNLDKMLWVALHRSKNAWRVKHIEICASEPPHWYLEQYGGLVWPCGVYAGLDDSGGQDLQARCRQEQRKPGKKPR